MSREQRFAAVHQFHPGVASGDAITQQMLETRRVLRAAGYESRILVVHPPAGPLGHEVEAFGASRVTPGDLLLVHVSLGHPDLASVVSLPCAKALIYHGITPSALLAESPALRHLADLGRAQLAAFRERWVRVIVDSAWNEGELRALGYGPCDRWPPVLPIRALLASPSNEALATEMRHTTNVLFVGRYAPNKRQEDLVRAFAAYRALRPRSARLRLVGNDAAFPAYRRRLEGLAAELGVSEAVDFRLRIDRADLVALYRTAAVFVCLSVHEGFGVPLVEAMAFDVPVIARRAAAVSEVLGEAGVLVDDADPERIAGWIHRLTTDEPLRSAVRGAQRRRLDRLDDEGSGVRLRRLVEEIERTRRRAA